PLCLPSISPHVSPTLGKRRTCACGLPKARLLSQNRAAPCIWHHPPFHTLEVSRSDIKLRLTLLSAEPISFSKSQFPTRREFTIYCNITRIPPFSPRTPQIPRREPPFPQLWISDF